jgi:hypothetical protein
MGSTGAETRNADGCGVPYQMQRGEVAAVMKGLDPGCAGAGPQY